MSSKYVFTIADYGLVHCHEGRILEMALQKRYLCVNGRNTKVTIVRVYPEDPVNLFTAFIIPEQGKAPIGFYFFREPAFIKPCEPVQMDEETYIACGEFRLRDGTYVLDFPPNAQQKNFDARVTICDSRYQDGPEEKGKNTEADGYDLSKLFDNQRAEERELVKA